MINERKNRNALPEPPAPAPTPKAEFKDTVKLSKDEYNSEIVQEYLKDFQKGLHEAAKTTRKDSGNSR